MNQNTSPFLSSIEELRRRAREHMEKGAVTPDYHGDLPTAIRVLNEALATELVCTLRYKSHYYAADGIVAPTVAEEFLEHAGEEEDHAERIAKRIKELGGQPDLNPATLLARSHAEYTPGAGNLAQMIREDLLAERIAIESYREMVRYFGQNDPTTRRMLEEILAKEEEHAEELSSLLVRLAEPLKATHGRRAG